MQETVLRAWRNADTLSATDRPLRPWLFTVAGRLAVDQHRARQSRPQEVGPELLEHAVTDGEFDRALESWEVEDALNTLSSAHREAIVESFYRGRSVVEAASVLGIPPGTLKSRLYYGLRALRLTLEERGWTP